MKTGACAIAAGAMVGIVMSVSAVAAQTATGGVGDKLKAGKAKFEAVCGTCHSLDKPLAKNLDREGWGKTIDRMKSHGAAVDDAGRELVLAYLATKSTYETKCSTCHGIGLPAGKNKSAADWQATVARMAAKKPGHLTDAEAADITAYLALTRPAH